MKNLKQVTASYKMPLLIVCASVVSEPGMEQCPKNSRHTYRTRIIITRGLHNLYPIFEGQKCFARSFFHKILLLCMVNIEERFVIKSGL